MANIDFVVPMVFPSDRQWRREYKKTCTRLRHFSSPDGVRFRSWDTERLLVCCVRKFMPWVRDIIILVASDSQIQPWMTDCKVVTHAEFIPSEFLPTYNSRAIEMFLHRIPGLSECFLYANDDMFPLSPLKQSDFFRKGVPCQHHDEVAFPTQPGQFHRACMNGLNMVAANFGKNYFSTWLHGGHSIAPILKSTCLALWDLNHDDIEDSITPFRHESNYNQYIYSWHQHFSGNFIDHVPARHYAGVRLGLKDTLSIISQPDCGIVCVNDQDTLIDMGQFAAQVKKAINEKLK